jgi:predicted nucleic acid-binding protein
MIHYPDTSFLCAAYRRQAHTEQALAFREQMSEPLHFTGLLEFEFLQAVELQVWLHAQDRGKGYARREADGVIADWRSDVATGINRMVPCEMDAVLRVAADLSSRLTAKGGHRTLDILHVATAVQLGARKFLSFDARQRSLARAAGLQPSPRIKP